MSLLIGRMEDRLEKKNLHRKAYLTGN
uniref:Uncharacterized protein n=1 Tax=Anguilla anguilla TaxID=7936 RepID=A0A0E9PIL5_ANGAN